MFHFSKAHAESTRQKYNIHIFKMLYSVHCNCFLRGQGNEGGRKTIDWGGAAWGMLLLHLVATWTGEVSNFFLAANLLWNCSKKCEFRCVYIHIHTTCVHSLLYTCILNNTYITFIYTQTTSLQTHIQIDACMAYNTHTTYTRSGGGGGLPVEW